jgi:hypothetical protein
VYLREKDYMMIAYMFLVELTCEHLMFAYTIVLKYFITMSVVKKDVNKEVNKEIKNIKKIDDKFKRIVIYSRIIKYFIQCENEKNEKNKPIKFGKNIYLHVNPEDVVIYENILADNTSSSNPTSMLPSLAAYKILPKALMYSIDEHNYLSLFALSREKNNIVKAYRENWLYYASYSPIWQERISRYNGEINHTHKSVDFHDDDLEEEFYQQYGYEPDEQTLNVQHKCIKPITKKRNWTDFYTEHKKNSIIDIGDEYLREIDKICYECL